MIGLYFLTTFDSRKKIVRKEQDPTIVVCAFSHHSRVEACRIILQECQRSLATATKCHGNIVLCIKVIFNEFVHVEL
jgi:hypothetical protein